MGDHVIALIKFGEETHLNNLVERGEIYLNTIVYYKNSQHTEIGDKYEGASLIVNMENFSIKAENPDFEKPFIFQGLTGQLTQYSTDFTHCFSMYAVSSRLFESKNDHRIDKRMQEFGTHCVLIENAEYFLGAILDQLKKITGNYGWNLVDYKDFSPLGEHKPSYFNKTVDLSHQAEYRILARLNISEPIKLYVGSLKDYCKISTTKSMLETNWSAKRR